MGNHQFKNMAILSATCLTKGAKLLWVALDSLETATENSKQLELPLGLEPIILKAYDPKVLSQMLARCIWVKGFRFVKRLISTMKGCLVGSL